MRAALIQMRASMERQENLDRAEAGLAEAAAAGARVACLQELFATWFFAQRLDPAAQALAEPLDGPTLTRMRAVARRLGLFVVVPFYERAMAGELYNSAAFVDADGEVRGLYRKHHIPMSSHFQEKFYFRPGNLGYPVWETPYGRVGVMICYDRHFPEAARALGLAGAQVVFVPTATTRRGFSRSVWEAELKGHAIANGYFVGAVNRVGIEFESEYYGSSVFIDPIGTVLAQAGDKEDEVLVADLDLERLEEVRRAWPFYRDRRPDSYGPLCRP
ncbi:MAG TPA: nitrilase-related carbon-nitrogen hydrolase [Calidithermus sp.]|nr:nitrilase-related carbon-nitrogen hydrolase [Calidithermus sp.]